MASVPDRIATFILRTVPPVVGIAVPITLWAVFFWVPTDAGLGLSQRIFYYHMPAAVICFGAFAVAGVSSIAYLRTTASIWDHAASSAVAVGMLFATIALATGSVWARTAWGTWWTWDTRLTTFLILWLLFAAYLLLRMLARDNHMAPRFAAVLAIVGALNIPLVMMATRLWRTIHPQVVRNQAGGIRDSAMSATLLLCLATFALLFAWLWALRLRLAEVEESVEALSYHDPGSLVL